MNTKQTKIDVPNSEEFTRVLGQVTWLLTQTEPFKAVPIAEIEPRFVAPLILKQVRVFTKGKAPVAALSWAYASDEVVQKVKDGNGPLMLSDWRSGPKVIVVDVVSPFADPQAFTVEFLRSVSEAQKNVAT